MTPYEKRLWIHQEPEAVGDVSMGVFAPAGVCVCETERDESICIQQASEISRVRKMYGTCTCEM